MSEPTRVALVTCGIFPDLYDDDHPLRDALRERGVAVDAVRWDDPSVDWSSFALTVIRSPWDYVGRHDEFVAWARGVPRLANPADIVAWNTDKRYLAELADAGIPTIPTQFVGPNPAGPDLAGSDPAGSDLVGSGSAWTAPASGEWVVKPSISAGSQDTGRYTMPDQAALAEAHVARLTAAGRTAMVQPYLTAVDTAGETAVLNTPDANGELTFSHAIRKGPMLTGPDEGAIDPGSEDISPRTPSAAELDLARRVLAAIPGGTKRLLYARVDMIPGPDGTPMLIELELTEPSLFFRTAPGSATRLADAILARL